MSQYPKNVKINDFPKIVETYRSRTDTLLIYLNSVLRNQGKLVYRKHVSPSQTDVQKSRRTTTYSIKK